MSFFNNLLGGSNASASGLPDFFHEINSLQDLETALEESTQKNILIFKHSTRCVISKTVLRNLKAEIKESNEKDIKFYYLDLLNHRDVSNEIAEKLQVAHQSPQALLIKNKALLYHASHDAISLVSIQKNKD